MNERSLFIRALEIEDSAQRAELLSRECGDDDELRRRIERLLSAHLAAGGILDKPPVSPPATDLFRPITEGPGTVIGPYRLLQQIGEGGFGVVYMAEQQRPVRRKVALKIIKPGMDTREVIARFESERQALALMDHPNIARVFDAGATESGRPYFVMELVKGVPITDYCDKNSLPTDKRLALFITVCHAIQHAHQKGIIHRDLKPSNVMVTLHDGHPVPKVIDFGVSKATSQQLTERTLFTAYGQMIGTPAYMSPEQAEMSGLDIDTRSDLYSLGVLLYELLTGSTPFDGKRLREAGYLEMQRIIREEAPPRPSTRVSTLGEALTVLSSQRSTDPKKLGQLLRGDLDVIVMKALEKERNRRYDTPNAFADDIQRYLNREAIVARPASAAYRLKKFAQRNWAAVAATAAIAGALMLGSGVSTWLAIRESRASRQAEMERQKADSERQKAENSLVEAVAAKSEAERQRDRAEKAQAEESKQRQLALEQKQAAESAERAAAAERTAAVQERDKANAASAELARQKEQQRRLLYAAQMNLIPTAWNDGNILRVQELLNATRPRTGEADLRGLEWRYWQRMLHQEEQTFRLPVRLGSGDAANAAFGSRTTPLGLADLAAYSAVLSRDGTRLGAIEVQVSATKVRSSLKVWSTESGAAEPILSHELPLESVDIAGAESSLTRRSPRLALSSSGYAVAFLDRERVVIRFRRGTGPAERAALIAASQHLRDATPEDSERLRAEFDRLRNAATGFELRTILLDSTVPSSSQPAPFTVGGQFTFSPDGSRIASRITTTPDAETQIQILDGRTGAVIDQLASPFRRATLLALSAGGTRLAVAEDLRSSRPFPPGRGAGSDTQPLPPAREPPARSASPMIVINCESRQTVVLQPKSATENLLAQASISASSCAFSANSQHLAIVSSNLRMVPTGLALFDSSTGSEIFSATGPQGGWPSGGPRPAAFVVAFSPDGKTLVSNVGDPGPQQIALWDAATGKQGRAIQGHTSIPVLAAFSADGSRLTTADESGIVKVWRVPAVSGESDQSANDPRAAMVARLETGRGVVTSPDGRWKASAPSSRSNSGRLDAPGRKLELTLEDTKHQVPSRTIPLDGAAEWLEFSPNSELLAVVILSADAQLDEAVELRVFSVATGEALPLPIPRFGAADWGRRDEQSLAPRGQGGPPGGRNLASRVSYCSPPAFSPDSRRLAIKAATMTSNARTDCIHLWDIEQNRELPVDIPLPTNRSGTEFDLPSFSPDGKLLLVSSRVTISGSPLRVSMEHGIQVADAFTGKFLWQAPSPIDSAVFTADSRVLAGIQGAATGGVNGGQAVVMWEAATGRELRRIELPFNREWFELSPSARGDRIAVRSRGGVIVYDTATALELYALDATTGSVRFSPDGQRLMSSPWSSNSPRVLGLSIADAFRTVREFKVWDAFIGQELLSVRGDSPLFSDVLNGSTTAFASPSPQVEAESLVDWLAAADADRRFLSRRQIAERLNSDASLSAEARAIALRLAAKLRRSAAPLSAQALSVVRPSGLPRENYERALDWINEALEQSPNDARCACIQGMAYYRLENYAEALTALQRCQELRMAAGDPVHPAALAFLAMTRHQLGHNQQAREYFYQADRFFLSPRFRGDFRGSEWDFGDPQAGSAEIAPDTFESLDEAVQVVGLRRASGLIENAVSSRVENRDYDQALRLCSAAIALDPQNWQAFLERARTWQLKNEFDKALADCDESLRLNPDLISSVQERARVLGRLGRFGPSLADYTRAIELSAGREAASAYLRRGYEFWFSVNQYDLAIQDFSEAIRLGPELIQAAAYGNRGICWIRSGEYEKALADFEQALRRDPTSLGQQVNRGAARILLGRHDDGRSDLDAVIRQDSKIGAAHFWLGYSLEKQGQAAEAEKAFEAFLATAKSRAEGLSDLAVRWGHLKQYGKAIDTCTALIGIQPDAAAAYVTRGEYNWLVGKYAEAVADLTRAIEIDPSDTEAHSQLAWIRATCPDKNMRDPAAAVIAAEKACQRTAHQNWVYLDTLATAHAAAGKFAVAIQHQEAALKLLAGFEKPEYRSRLALFRQNTPYLAPPLPPPTSPPSP